MDLRLALVEIKIEYIILMLKNNFLEKDYFHNVGRWLQGQGRFQNLYTEGALKLKTFLRYWFLIINEKLYNIFCERGGGALVIVLPAWTYVGCAVIHSVPIFKSRVEKSTSLLLLLCSRFKYATATKLHVTGLSDMSYTIFCARAIYARLPRL